MNEFNARYSTPFEQRHNGPSNDDVRQMLEVIGVGSLDELIDKTVPTNIRMKDALNVGVPQSEAEFLNQLKKVASKNKVFKNYIGMGYYNTLTPTVILRNI